ncbi:hypothetical protein NAEGRDRAFT_81424 [Naegleria gruberi]|uniref:Uncharacterized protein n=1 Tax=Naegleria gruberi TaxID=5762 RepID=D2VVW8_NAEGR|nr:uncharacterized protein NAEGRDRAFT_81424 [Naegleria gruberi]EFC38913.1 hypothetical protein NAEGRDRAFT_81424 [Naegleria gruberi]|eukprot:XP_002671657.1 hypothetical protein NAEGRDRAFT_81424 [Naegleria gruberi strain NEG-M]
MQRLKRLLFSNSENNRDDSQASIDEINNIKTKQQYKTLVLFGSGGSGKSSIFKKCVNIKEDSILLVYSILLKFYSWKYIPNLKSKLTNQENVKLYETNLELLPHHIEKTHWTVDVANAVFKVYWDIGLQKELLNYRFQIPFWESIQYFMKKENFDKLLDLNNCDLNDEDLFFASFKTVGIHSLPYKLNENQIIIDTGKY